MTVGDRLAASRAAHRRYREIHTRTENRDEAGMLTAIREARDQRLAAHAWDPDHTDPAWQADTVSHASLMQFYEHFDA